MNNLTSDQMLVTFYGTRGSISTPGRSTEKYGGNTPCVEVRAGDTIVIIDAGTGIRPLGQRLANEIRRSGKPMTVHLLISHTHWDHIQGLPFFQPAYMKEASLVICGSTKKESFLEQVLRGQMDTEYFPVEMSAFQAGVKIKEITNDTLKIGDLSIDWQEQHLHPGGCVRFRFRYGDSQLVYASDVELDPVLAHNDDPELKRLYDEYMAFVEGSDLLIADGQYTPEEYAARVGWGHTSLPVAMEVAGRANVKQLALFHHDPDHSDAAMDELWNEYVPPFQKRYESTNVFWAREGMTLAV